MQHLKHLTDYAIKLGCGLGLSLAVWPVQAQGKLPAPVAPPTIGALPAPVPPTQPQPALPAPVSSHLAPSTDPLPVVSAPQANAVVVPVAPDVASKTAALTVPLLITQWRDRKSTPQEAWDKGALTVEDLIYILNHSIDYWGGFYWEKDVDLRRAIVALLVQHGGDKIAKPQTLSPFVRLWLADYYESIGDVRTLPLCEGILSEIKAPIKGENALAFQAIERIGWYYRDKGQYEQGAQAWLRMMNYHADIGWWTPDALIEAAHLKMQAGDSKQAQNLYAQIAKYGDGWCTGAAVDDQAVELIMQGKHAEARKLLQQPITGPKSDDIQVALLALMACSYYETGEFKLASQYSEKAIAKYNSLENPRKDVGLEAKLNVARAIIGSSSQWLAHPFFCVQHAIRIIANQETKQDGVVIRHLTIHAAHPLALAAVTDNSSIQAIVAEEWEDHGYFSQKEVVIKIMPQALQKSSDSTVSISSPTVPDFKVQVPIQVEVESPIQLSSSVVFFGFVKSGQAVSKALKLTALIPFRILKVETDNGVVQAQPDATEGTQEHAVTVKLTPQTPGQIYSGIIHIKTDNPQQELLDVPYMAQVE